MCNVYTWMLRQWPHFKLLRCFSDTNDDTKYHFHQSFICWPSFQIPGQEYLWWEQRLVRGRGGGTFSWRRHIMIRVSDTGHVTPGGDRLSSEHRGCDGGCDHPEATLVTGSGCWISWPRTTPQWTETGMWTQLRGAPVLFWAHTGWQLRLGQHRVCRYIQHTGCWSQCPGQWAVTAVARPGWRHRPGPDWGQSGAGITPGHTIMWTLCQVRNSENYVMSEKDAL